MGFFEEWSFGYEAILGIIVFPILYLVVRQIRRFLAWANGNEPPKKRKVVYVIILAILGFFAGGLLKGLLK